MYLEKGNNMKRVTRIRYAKQMVDGEGAEVSQEFMTPTHIVRALIFPTKGFYWCIQGKDVTSREVETLAKASSSCEINAKKDVKRELKRLGVQFTDEVRAKRKQEVSQ